MRQIAIPIAILCAVGLAFAWFSRNPLPANPPRSAALTNKAECAEYQDCKIGGGFPRQVVGATLKHDFVQIDLALGSYWSKALLVPTAGELTKKALVALAAHLDEIDRARTIVVIVSVKDGGRMFGMLRAAFPKAAIAQAAGRNQRTIFQLASSASPLAGAGGAEVLAFCREDADAHDTGPLCK